MVRSMSRMKNQETRKNIIVRTVIRVNGAVTTGVWYAWGRENVVVPENVMEMNNRIHQRN